MDCHWIWWARITAGAGGWQGACRVHRLRPPPYRARPVRSCPLRVKGGPSMLTEACAPMLWRRVAHPQTINHYATEIMDWPQVGGDIPSILSCTYDGGNVIVGFGCQAEEMTPEVCSYENLRRVE